MGTFSFSAANREGGMISGIEEAPSATVVERDLVARGLYPLEVRAVEPTKTGPTRPSFGFGARKSDVVEAVATLSTLLEAGLPLDQALEVVGRGSAQRDLARAIEAVQQRVRRGDRFADALTEHSKLFPPSIVGLIRAGEQGGHLPEAVQRASQYLDREAAFRAKMTSALTYPAVLAVAGTGAVLLLMVYVVPRLVEVLSESGAQVPASAALLLGLSSFLQEYWFVPLLAAVSLLLGLTILNRDPAWRAAIHRLLLGLPALGPLRARRASARLTGTLATLLSGGIPLVVSLDIAADAIGDEVIAADIRRARDAVQRGESLSSAFRSGPYFPHTLVRLVEVGEESGQLVPLLERLNRLLEVEVERKLERLLSLLEPTMILALGITVGFVAVSLVQAVYGVHADAF